MKALVVFDSFFGNTEQIALAIGEALGYGSDVKVLRVSDIQPEYLTRLKMLIVGSPTRGFRATLAINTFLKGITKKQFGRCQSSGF